MPLPLKILAFISVAVISLVVGFTYRPATSSGENSSGQPIAKTVKLHFQSCDPSGSTNYKLKQQWVERVKVMSGGRIEIKLHSAGVVVEHKETLNALSDGVLDGHITDPGYFSGIDPAFGLIGNTVGAWSDPNDMLLFMEKGGGTELLREIYKPYGIHFIGTAATGLEAFVSKKPLNGVEDLKGLKVRAPEGLVNAVFKAAGAAPVNLPSSEVYTSLDKGVIDAADSTVFSTNDQLGMHKIAKSPVYPGFHSMPILDFSINKKSWDKLSPDLQAIMTASVRNFAREMVSELRLNDLEAVARVQAKGDVTIHDWSAVERKKFRNIAMLEWKKFSTKSPNAEKVYEVLTKFLAENGMIDNK